MNAVQPFQQQLQQLRQREAGPAWLEMLRRDAMSRLQQSGFPDPRHEEWKYTRVQPLLAQPFVPAAELAGRLAMDELADLLPLPLAGPRLVLVNGFLREELSDLAALPGGVEIHGLKQQLQADPDALRESLGRLAEDRHSPFVSLNEALFEDGLQLRVDAGTVVEQPLQIVHVLTAEAEPQLAHPRLLLVLGESAELTLLEHFVGQPQAAGFANAVAEVELGANAGLRHYRLQNLPDSAYLVADLHLRQQRDSRYDGHGVDLGGRLARQDINISLAEPGARTRLNGLYLAGARQHVDNHVRVHHEAPHTYSDSLYRGILGGPGRAVFKGRVLVARDAQKIEAHLNNANLLLSERAEVDTKPELEIYADDVICSHGATVGQIDEAALYYLRARGIEEATARNMLIFAFAEAVIGRLGLAELEGALETAILQRLPGKDALQRMV